MTPPKQALSALAKKCFGFSLDSLVCVYDGHGRQLILYPFFFTASPAGERLSKMQRSAHMKLPRRPGLSSLNVAAALYLSSNPTRMALGYPARQSGLHPNSGMVFSISQTRFTCMTGPPCEQVQPHQRRFGSVAPLQRDTIYALATAPGKAGVAIIRISGCVNQHFAEGYYCQCYCFLMRPPFFFFFLFH